MDDRIKNAALRLAIHCTEKANLPKRFNAKKDDLFVEEKKNSVVERNFQNEILSWENFIKTVLEYQNTDSVWRFFSISPKVEKDTKQVTLCKDFIEMTDLFIKIRNAHVLPEIVGRFSLLHSSMQKEIEKSLLVNLD